MKYRRIADTDISVSEVSLGCWTMGGLNWVNGSPNGWADPDEDEITGAVRKALDAGVNHFDNADVYGNGRAERMLARVLDRLGVKTDDLIIATKIGHFPGTAEHAYTPHHIRQQCEQSLINLRRDHIDIYYFHHGNFGEDRQYLPEAVETMNQLVAEGKVRLKGQSAYSDQDFEELVPTVKPKVLQSWANALSDNFIRPGSTLQTLMEQHKLSFVAFSPLAQARLLDKYDPANPPSFAEGDNRRNNRGFSAEKLADLKPRLAVLKSRFGSKTEDLAGMALRFVLEHPHVACVIPGFRNADQVACNLSATNCHLTEEDLAFIRETLAS